MNICFFFRFSWGSIIFSVQTLTNCPFLTGWLYADFFANCTHLLTRTQEKKFEGVFLVKMALKQTILKILYVDTHLPVNMFFKISYLGVEDRLPYGNFLWTQKKKLSRFPSFYLYLFSFFIYGPSFSQAYLVHKLFLMILIPSVFCPSDPIWYNESYRIFQFSWFVRNLLQREYK